MNRIILIGNGFDLAHGLETSYKHFIDDFWKQFPKKINDCSKLGIKNLVDDYKNVNIKINHPFLEIPKINNFKELEQYINSTGCGLTFTNKFLEIITYKRSFKNWVDVEVEYYQILKEIANGKKSDYKDISELNADFEKIKYLLIKFLKGKDNSAISDRHFEDSIFDFWKPKHKSISNHSTEQINLEYDRHILFLNFNYTQTHFLYINPKWQTETNFSTESIKIHGNLENFENPIIFGHGDELDDDYKTIEKLGDNRFLDFVKSIEYLKTDNYKKLISFIDSAPYQVFIFGHSCGLSDRTLLNTLFEHDNCISIKPFFYEYEDENGIKKDNYIELVQNISRNFNDKVKMRNRVIDKTNCEPIPQTIK